MSKKAGLVLVYDGIKSGLCPVSKGALVNDYLLLYKGIGPLLINNSERLLRDQCRFFPDTSGFFRIFPDSEQFEDSG